MEVLQHLEDLEDLIDRAKHIMGKALLVDVDKFFMLTNKIRAALPDEVKKATRITHEGERMMADSRERSVQIIDDAKLAAEELLRKAKEEAAALTDSHTIANAARDKAREIIDSADETARRLHEDAEQYVRAILADLESHLSRVMSAVHKGLAKIDDKLAMPSVVAVPVERGQPGLPTN